MELKSFGACIMAMSINDLMVRDGGAIYYTAAYRRMLETHMAYLRERSANNIVAIEPHLAYKYEASLFDLLHHLKVDTQHHWLVMRLNDFTSPTQLRSDQQFLILPDFNEIDRLRSVFQTANRSVLQSSKKTV